MTVIDEYFKKVDAPKSKQLDRIRKIAKQVVPGAQEVISYGMPTLKYKGESFLGFNAHTKHIGIYPYGGEEIEVFKEKISKLGYKFSSGAIRIPYDNPIPDKLLKEIIIHRVNRITNKE
ncbi:DUF1801 domain-containing protein [Patescibacteria group bacterium]|nr:DUF1801 domain-containing protein [Patescibacteria group bacterium]